MDDKSLEFYAGVGGGFSGRYTEIRVDNGDDTSGINATGEFVSKVGKSGNYTRTQYGKHLEGIVLVQRAKINRNDEWFSDEFNPLDITEMINIRNIKNAKTIWKRMTYNQIQEEYPKIPGYGGQMKNQFNYHTVLYVKDMNSEEIFQLTLSGKVMRDWIEFKNNFKVDLWGNSIVMDIIAEKNRAGKQSYTIEFKVGSEVEKSYVKSLVSPIVEALPKAEHVQIEGPKEGVQPEPKEDIPTIQLDEEEVVVDAEIEKNSDEIKVEDIPF